MANALLLEPIRTTSPIMNRRGYIETCPKNEERPVYRLSVPLKGLPNERDPYNLLTHQALYVPPHTWEFQRGNEKNAFGRNKLKIEQKHKPDVTDLSDWRNIEHAGTTTLTDGEIYQSCKFFSLLSNRVGWIFCDSMSASPVNKIPGRQYKKVNSKEYSLRSANCQHAADDIAYSITEGRSLLAPAPCRRIPEALIDACVDEGVRKTLLKASRATRHLVSHRSSPQTAVTGAMRRMYNQADASTEIPVVACLVGRLSRHMMRTPMKVTTVCSSDLRSIVFENMMNDMNGLTISASESSLRPW